MRRFPFLPTPALLPGRKVRSLAGPTLFGPPATLRAETETFCLPGDARGGGLISEVKRLWSCNGRGAWPRLPSVAPKRTRPACRVRPSLPGIQRRPDSALDLAHLVAGEPPRPVPLSRPHRAASEAAPSERPTLPPQLACRQRSTRPASPNASSAPRRSPQPWRPPSGSRPKAGKPAVSSDRPGNDLRGSRTTA